jgi:hypothetical protein
MTDRLHCLLNRLEKYVMWRQFNSVNNFEFDELFCTMWHIAAKQDGSHHLVEINYSRQLIIGSKLRCVALNDYCVNDFD